MMLGGVVRLHDTEEAECQLRRRCVRVPSQLGVRVRAEVHQEIPAVRRGRLQSGQRRMCRSSRRDRGRQMAAKHLLHKIRALEMRQRYVGGLVVSLHRVPWKGRHHTHGDISVKS